MASTQNLQNLATTAPPVSPGQGWERITPIDRLNREDVWTALLDAVATFGIVSIVGGITVMFIYVVAPTSYTIGEETYHLHLGWWLLGAVPVLGALGGMVRYFGGLQLAKNLLEIVESAIDVSRPEPQPEPEPQRHVIGVEIKESSGRWQFGELPGSDLAVYDLAWAVIKLAQSFSERTALDSGFNQGEWNRLRDLFLDRSWVKWINPDRRQVGLTLTPTGKYILTAIIDSPPPSVVARRAELDIDSTQQHAAGYYQHIQGT